MFACIHLPAAPEGGSKALQDCAESFGPEAEMTAPNTVVFEVSRLKRLYGGWEQIAEAVAREAGSMGLDANIAIAPNPETALLAARNFRGVTVIPEEAAAALAGLDIESLPLTPELWELLDQWGIRTLRDFTRLPETGLAERLGIEGLHLQRLARGSEKRPLRVARCEVRFEERVELEHALTELEPLLFILGRILSEQCEKLQSHGMATNAVRLKLELEDRTTHVRELRLPLPVRQNKAMLKLLQLELEAHRPQAAVQAVELVLIPVNPRTVQNGIFLPVTPEPDRLEVTLTRIGALVGKSNVGVAELLNTHRPAPFQLTRYTDRNGKAEMRMKAEERAVRIAFWYFQPPMNARVECKDGGPVRLAAGSIRGNVITYAGPWRSSGDWWTRQPWDREEWDVSLNDGGIYRIYRAPDQSWFVEGGYD